MNPKILKSLFILEMARQKMSVPKFWSDPLMTPTGPLMSRETALHQRAAIYISLRNLAANVAGSKPGSELIDDDLSTSPSMSRRTPQGEDMSGQHTSSFIMLISNSIMEK